MTLQQPQPIAAVKQQHKSVYCRKCGAEIVFDKDHKAPNGKKVPLDPFFNNQPHVQYCMYAVWTRKEDQQTDAMFLDFLSMVPRQRKIIGAVGRAK